jgi:hypothetical protein
VDSSVYLSRQSASRKQQAGTGLTAGEWKGLLWVGSCGAASTARRNFFSFVVVSTTLTVAFSRCLRVIDKIGLPRYTGGREDAG